MGILDADVLHRLIAFDEAHFHISGYVNKQTYRYWRDEQPHSVFETLLHSLKVAVWCGLSASGITGLHFFEEGNCALTVTSTGYRVVPETLEVDADDIRGELRIQQDGATARAARESAV